LLVDFFVFIIETSLLFVLAATVTKSSEFFVWLLVLLGIDVLWGLATWPITKTVVLQWVAVNMAAAAVMALVMCLVRDGCAFMREWILAVLAVLRTILDYKFAWRFYFPLDEKE
jgi:hypothetical protein